MIQFLRKLWTLVLPYKGRLILGIMCGLVGGVMNPLLMMTVKLSMEVVFPGEGDPLVEIRASNMESNRLSSGLIVQANVSQLVISNLTPRITNWPGANSFSTNLLTITVGE